MVSIKRKLVAAFASLCVAGMLAAQNPPAAPSSGPTLPEAELVKQQQARTVAQPGNNQPVWNAVKSGASGYTSLPGAEMGVLIQPNVAGTRTTAGQHWRELRNGRIATIGGWVLVGLLGLVTLFYLWKGTIKVKEAPTGRLIERFTPFERVAHWSTAISFSILAISGLILAFGKYVLLPVFGYSIFATLAQIAKPLHNFVGPLFIVSCIVTFFTFLRDNWPKAVDFQWIFSFGGLISGKHVPSERFNAGEKVWFWGGLMVLGIVVGVSGLILNFPNFGQTRSTMQLANLVHFAGSLLFMAGALGHIYMGTLGMAGAFQAMKTGYVDDSWAKEHHEIWYNDVVKGSVKRVRSNVGSANALQGAGDD
jgi:formate dehydrogenase subunit gamma